MSKVQSAQLSLQTLNPHIEINTIHGLLSEEKLVEIIPHFDVVLDCTDNVDIRNQLDRCCQQARIPLISGVAIRFEGRVSVFTYEPNTPNYRSLSQLFGETVLSCVGASVISPIVGIVGSIQALEAIKVRLKIGTNLCGRLLMNDGLNMAIREIKLPSA